MGKRKQKKRPRPGPSSQSGIVAPRRNKVFYSRIREVLMLSFCAVLVSLIYSSSTEGPFILDDFINIKNNPQIRLTKFTLEGIRTASLGSHSSNRPVANLSFALNYYFHQYDVVGYRLVNILIHITTGILLCFFVRTTMNVPALRDSYEPHGWIPFVTTLIWLVHPIHTQSVAYIVQRMNSMAGMFYILSFLLYAKGRLAREKKKRWILFVGCTLSGLMSLGSKEIAATLPFFIFLYEWYFFQDMSWSWLKRQMLHFVIVLIIFALVAFVFLQSEAGQRKLSLLDFKDFALGERVLTEFRVVIHYISLLIFPHPSRLNLDYDFPLSHSLIDPVTTLLSIVTIAGLIALAIYIAKKERLLSFCILWFFGNLVIESSVIPLAIIFEHRTYLPSVLVSLLAVSLGYRYIKPKWVKVAILCVVVIVYSVWTYERNSVWSDDVTLWRDCVAKSPKKARAHVNLGGALVHQERLEEAMTHLYAALRIKPDFVEAHHNLGFALYRQGRHEEAIRHYTEALRIKPNFADAHSNLGVVLQKQGKVKEAMSHFYAALRIKPDRAEAQNNLGFALHRQGRHEEAIRHYTEALRINPNYTDAHYNLGVVLVHQERLGEAMTHFYAALRIEPDRAEAHYNLGITLNRQERHQEAIRHYTEALRIKPNYADAHNSLGSALEEQGRLKEAMTHFYAALRIKPDFADAHYNLGNALNRQERHEEAIRHYKEALRIEPNFADAHYNLGVALVHQERLEEAMSHFYAALQIKPDRADAHYNLGVVLLRQGDRKGAAFHFSEALRIEPNNMRARHALELVSE